MPIALRSMSMLILGAALAGTPAPVQGGAKVTEVGRWRILSGTSSAGAYCTMQQGTPTTKVVGIQVRANGVKFMSVGDPAWAFTPPQQMTIKIEIDGKPAFAGNAIVVMPNILVVPLSENTDAVEAMAGGKSLTVTVEKGSATYDLAGAGAARDALKTCLAAAGKM